MLAGLHHDTAEDGPLGPDLTLRQLDAELGSNVAATVQIFTKNSGLDRVDRVRDVHARLLHGLSTHGTGLAARSEVQILLAQPIDTWYPTTARANFGGPFLFCDEVAVVTNNELRWNNRWVCDGFCVAVPILETQRD